jgi:hypothetical protein
LKIEKKPEKKQKKKVKTDVFFSLGPAYEAGEGSAEKRKTEKLKN